MLGLNLTNETNKQLNAIGNFLVTLLAMLVYIIIEKVPQNRLPTEIEIFWAIIIALATTFGIYGINKATSKS